MCSYFQEQSKDSVRQIIFSSLFSPQGNKADDSRMSLLGKLVSMAVAVCRIPVLECAASWLQVLFSKYSCFPESPQTGYQAFGFNWMSVEFFHTCVMSSIISACVLYLVPFL